MKLMMSDWLYSTIEETIGQTPEGLETGVTLLGIRQENYRTALFALGPGPKAIHRTCFHQADTAYLNEEFNRLRQVYPKLEWIGSFHVHPFGMPSLSGHDTATLENLFSDEELGLSDFTVGIIQRRNGRLAIYPYYLEVGDSFPWLLPLEIVSEETDIISTAEAIAGSKDAGDTVNSENEGSDLAAVNDLSGR